MVNALRYQKELERLREEHHTIDNEISSQLKLKVINSFIVQALKKKKLSIKRSIQKIESILLGDIVA